MTSMIGCRAAVLIGAVLACAGTVRALDDSGRLRCDSLGLDQPVEALTAAWRGTLDW